MSAKDSQRPLSLRQLTQMIREWAAAEQTEPIERLDLSLIKSGGTVNQIDFQPKRTFKGVMTLD